MCIRDRLTRGLTPVEVRPLAQSRDAMDALGDWLGRRVPTDDLLLFSRQMYSITKSGVPLMRGLRAIQETTRNRLLQRAIRDIVSDVEGGRALAESMRDHPRVFNRLYISIVDVGEQSGRLEEAFTRLYEYLSFDKGTAQRIKTAMRYPIIVLVAVGIAVAVLMTMVIPQFANVLSRFGAELPWATRAVIAISDFSVRWWQPMLALGVFAAVLLRVWVRTELGAASWDRLKLRLPVIGGILRRAAVARFARAFTVSYRSGVPLDAGMRLVEEAVGNAHLAKSIAEMRERIERGDGLGRAAAATAMLTPLAVQMVSLGEETGEVDEMMEEVADYYEREVEYEVENLSSAIEPILTIAVGVVVLVLALAVFVPMWELFSSATGRGR